MAKSKFIVTATLKLVPDGSNLAGITKAINKALKQVPKKTNIDLKVRLNSANFKAVKNSLNQLTKNINVKHVEKLNSALKQTSNETRVLGADFAALGHQAALATRRFGGFVIGTFAIRELGFAFKETFKDALQFQESLVKVGQVTKTSLKDLSVLEKTITSISTSLGVDSEQLIAASQTLSQAGLSLKDTEIALSSLAKTTLSPSFGSLEDTTEGLISAMAQFKFSAGGAESVLSSINAIAAKTAVESEDLIDVIKRTGGAFQATGGDLNELLALFTSVRATTRESAGTIGTGFRTIFTRLQRPGTIDFLNSLGIELRDANNQFIGGYEAVRKLSAALNQLPSTDPRFAQIVEELGGIRQISKVIPLIKEFGKAEQALGFAMAGRNSIQEDIVRSQESMLRQFREVKEEFKALVREFANNTAVKAFISLMLEVARTLIRVGDAIIPLLPLFTALGAKAGVGAIGKFLAGTSARGQRGFVPTLTGVGMKSGGSVGGVGSGDKIPAMLEPGEFVLKKNVARKVGYSTLNAINDGTVRKFAAGGIVGKLSGSTGAMVAIGGAISLINTFGSLDKAVQKTIATIGSLAAEFYLITKAVKLARPDPITSPSRGTRDVKFDRIVGSAKTSVENIDDKIKSNIIRRNQINLRRGNILNELIPLSGEVSRSISEGSNPKALLPEFNQLKAELSKDVDKEKLLRFIAKNENVFEARRLKELSITRGKITKLSNIPNEPTDVRNARLQRQAEVETFFDRNPNLRGIVPESRIPTAASLTGSRKGQITKRFNQLLAEDQAKAASRAQQLSELQLRSQQLQRPTLTGAEKLFVQSRGESRARLAELQRTLNITQPIFDRRDYLRGTLTTLDNQVAGIDRNDPDLRRQRQTRINRLKQVRRGRFLQKAITGVDKFGGAAGAIGAIGGSLLSDFGTSEIAAGRNGKVAAVAGGTLAGAGQGAIFGSIFGPIGTAAGAAIGAIGGFTSALINANKQIEDIKFNKSFDELSKIITSISSGLTNANFGGARITTGLETLRTRIGKATGEDLISARGSFEAISPGIQDFFNKVAQSSSTFEQFRSSVGNSFQIFSELAGIPVGELSDLYKNQIKAQNEAINVQKLFNAAAFESGLQLRASLSFLEGLEDSARKTEDFSNSIKDFSSIIEGIGGSIGTDKIPGIRSQEFSTKVGNVGGFFGPEAANILSELSTASKAMEILPDILIDLKSNTLSEAGDLDIRLRRALSSNLGVSPSNEVIDKFINTFRRISGEEGDPKFLKEMETNFSDVIEEFSGSVENSEKIFRNSIENIQGILSEYASGLQEIANLEKTISDLRLRSIDTVISAEKTLAEVFERDINFGGLAQVNAIRNGPNSPQQLGAIIAASTARAQSIQDRLRSGGIGGFAENKALLDARHAELVIINKAKESLERLADTSNTTSNSLEQLEKLRKDRDTKREFASSFVFGGASERREIGLGIQAATLAANQGSLRNIPDLLKDNVLQIFRQFSDVRLGAFGNLTGLEAEKKVLEGTAREAGLSPEDVALISGKAGTEEQRLQQAIVDGINTSMEAQRTLAEVAVNDQKTLIQITQTGFVDLAKSFRDTILAGQQAGLKSRLQLTQSTIGDLRSKQGAFAELEKLGITTPEQIKSFKEGIPQQAQQAAGTIANLQSLLKQLETSARFGGQKGFDETFSKVRQDLFNTKAFTFEQISQLGKLRVFEQVETGGPATGTVQRSNIGEIKEFFVPELKKAGQELGALDLRAFGGVVPNVGNNERITKLLSVVGDTKQVDIAKQLTEQGGITTSIQNQIDQLQKLRENNSAFGDSINQFNSSASTLAQTLSAFPSEVGHNINGRVEVIINGAQVFETIGPQMSELIESKVNAAINDFTRNNFPQLKPNGPNRQVRPR